MNSEAIFERRIRLRPLLIRDWVDGCSDRLSAVRWGRSLPQTPTSSRDSQRDIEAGIDYFKLLGVREEAEAAEVVSAFRARVRAVHPDANAGAGDPERVALLVRARSTLMGPEREAYTIALRAHRAKHAARATPPTPRPTRPVDRNEARRGAKAREQADRAREEERERERERQARARVDAEAMPAWDDASFEPDGFPPDLDDLEFALDDEVRRAEARAEDLLRQGEARVAAQVARSRANVAASYQRTLDEIARRRQQTEADIARQRRKTEADIARTRANVAASHQRTRDDIERQSRRIEAEAARSRAAAAAWMRDLRGDAERELRDWQAQIDAILKGFR